MARPSAAALVVTIAPGRSPRAGVRRRTGSWETGPAGRHAQKVGHFIEVDGLATGDGRTARRAEQQVFPHREVRKQARLLEDIAQRALVRRQEGSVRRLPDVAADIARPSGKRRKPARQRSTVVLPQPDGPNSAVTPLAGAVKPASRTKLPMVPRNSAWIVCAAVMRASARNVFRAWSWTGSPRRRRPPCRPRGYWPRANAWFPHNRKWRST